MKILNKLLSSSVLFASVMTFSNIGLVQADELKVGANVGNVPWEFQNEKGEVVGFEIDLVNKVAERLGDTVVITTIPFNGLFSAVQSGRIDMAASSITITDKRLESVSFAQPYYDSDQSLTVKANSDIDSVDALKGKVVAVDTGSTGDMWASSHEKELAFKQIRKFEGISPAMLDLVAGRIDGYISDIPAMQYYTKDKANLEVVARIPTGEKYGFMFAKNSPKAQQVNDVISELKKEGYLSELHEKWFGSKPEDNTSTVQILDMPKAK